ncbi:MAG: U32 family peptidase [Elusimicrobia bacterium]|nr:U32 family peptidase [Elusimicrobiota bacterium]
MASIELLAPAKDLDCGKAALDCGADAVYIGAPEFGARRAASNQVADIAKLAAYAHRYWAKVYPAVNTLLTDAELPRARKLLWDLYEAGADGLIIQDTGLLELDLPPLPLIASTQMHNHSPERVRFLQDVGFKRAILARELSLEEIRAIRRETSIELECFVHGALCVSFSGQCSMSYALGRRSGNRGDCAQPCRRSYTLLDQRGKVLVRDRYLLSLKDLDLSAQLPALLDAGVTSFKIEGRLKDAVYVKNITAHYRKLLDPLLKARGLAKASSGGSEPGFTPDPAKTFNRGRTTYLFFGSRADIASPDTPTALGEPVGRVAAMARASFILDGAALSAGDGLCWFDDKGRLEGAYVRAVQGPKVFPESMGSLKSGTRVWRNLDRSFQNAVNKARPERTMQVMLELSETGQGLTLKAADEDGVSAEAVLALDLVEARDPGQAEATALAQLRKLGDTAFRAAGMDLRWSKPWFVPVAKLNGLRRDLVARLEAGREQARPKERPVFARNSVPFPEAELDYRSNCLNAKARAFYERHGAKVGEPAAEAGLDMRGRVVMTTKLCLRRLYGACRELHHILVSDTGPVAKPAGFATGPVSDTCTLVDEDGNRFRLEFDCAACVMKVVFEGRIDTPRREKAE